MSYDELDDEFYQTEFTDTKKVALYILDGSGNVEDILVDLDDILNYVKRLYEKYPTAD
jgi:hypothetical protein